MEQFATYVRQELADVQAQMDAVQQQITPLQQTLAWLQTKAETLTAYIAIETPPAWAPATPPGTTATRIERVLRRAGIPLHYKEILQRLATEEGTPVGGKDPGANITALLSAKPQFVRVAPGTYTLRD